MNIQGFAPAMPAAVQNASLDGGLDVRQLWQHFEHFSTSSSSLQSTFLNLLITELQNRDRPNRSILLRWLGRWFR